MFNTDWEGLTPRENFTPFILLYVKLANFVIPFLLLSVSVKITYCLEGKMVTPEALSKLNMTKLK
jgi:hypothetical protein